MHWPIPLVASLLGASLPSLEADKLAGPVERPVAAAPVKAVRPESPTPKVFTLPLRVPEAQLKSLLRSELTKKKLLKNFQVATSKFSNGRVVLDSLDVLHGPRPGTVRLEAHARLRFDRRQLGVRWRGLKSHKKWFEKGAKDAANVRVTCVATLGELANSEDPLGASLTSIRVKIVSRLRPARGLTARFDVDDKQFGWTPEGGLFDHVKISSLRIAGVERDALRLEIEVTKASK